MRTMLNNFLKSLCFVVVLFYSTVTTSTASPSQKWNRYELTGELASFRTASYDRGSNKLYMGGVNRMYEFNPENVTSSPNELIWKPNPRYERTCRSFKSDVNLCQNNIRVFVSINDTHLYACGTMAFLPTCTYVLKENFTQLSKLESGRWKTPQDPYVSTISVIANQTLFTATKSSSQGNDAIISRALNGITLRTKANDKFWLNDPVFIGGYHVANPEPLQGKVMLFFREKAEEFLPYLFGMAQDSSERNIASRVATVCVNDHGGSAYVLNRRFATYVKKTIVCSAPKHADDEKSFQYTHLESTFEMVDDSGRSTIYGIFTLPNDAIAGSAVCAFHKDDIETALMSNHYWTRNGASGTINTTYTGSAETSPGQCVQETRLLSQTRLTFSQNHPIKFGYIFPSQRTPFYQEPGTRFSHIVVDKVTTDHTRINENVTVLYMLTASGLLKRVIFPSNNPTRNWTLPDVQIVELRAKESVIEMILGDGYLYVVTNLTVVQMPLAACSVYASCDECFNAVDPYCIAVPEGSCVPAHELSSIKIQEISSQQFTCPPPPSDTPREQLLIDELRTNLSRLLEENTENEERLEEMTSERDRLSVEYASCTSETEIHREENKELRDRLLVTEGSLENMSESYNETEFELDLCQRTRRIYRDHALRIALELRRRPTRKEHQKQIDALTQSREGILHALDQCNTEKSKVVRQAFACRETMKTANARLLAMNTSCLREKVADREAFNTELETVRGKLAQMYESLLAAEVSKNNTLYETTKKLKLCYNQAHSLLGYNSLLRKEAKNITLNSENLMKQKKRLTWLLKRYRNQHICDNGSKWYLPESSNNMFLLMDERATFENAVEKCLEMNSSLAIFRNNEELGHIMSLIRASQPNHYYWIGLVKHTDGSMRWQDGSAVEQFRSRIATQNVGTRTRTTYCAEVTGSEAWELAPCYRLRRYICQKERQDVPSTKTIEKK